MHSHKRLRVIETPPPPLKLYLILCVQLLGRVQ